MLSRQPCCIGTRYSCISLNRCKYVLGINKLLYERDYVMIDLGLTVILEVQHLYWKAIKLVSCDVVVGACYPETPLKKG